MGVRTSGGAMGLEPATFGGASSLPAEIVLMSVRARGFFSKQTQSRACLASGLHHSWVLDPHKCRCARLPTFSSPCELAFRCRAEWTLTVETSWDVVVIVVV